MKEWFKTFASKLLSVKTWVTLACVVLAFFIVLKNLSEFNNIALLCIIEVIAYSGVNITEDLIKKLK